MCYIQGGTPKGTTSHQDGCTDKTPPVDDIKIEIPHELYFAKSSSKWGGGVAFIGLNQENRNMTRGRAYLITKEQFTEVVKQENNNKSVLIDFESVIKNLSSICLASWYGNVIFLGYKHENPIFTFTYDKNIGKEPFTKPSIAYLKVIAEGLREKHNLTNDEIAKYLINKSGVKGNYTVDDLVSQL
jgi:hypothetical protein